MSWEIEHHHVDLAEMEHVTTFIERSVTTRHGEPVRKILQIRLNDHLAMNEAGDLVDAEGKIYDIKGRQQKMLADLNQQHARGRSLARKLNAPLTGPKK
jgi:hypothetical protein